MTTELTTRAGLAALVGDGLPSACIDGRERPYLSLDAAASTSALPAVAQAVQEFLPWYSSVHRGAGLKSQRSTNAYEAARTAALCFAGRPAGGDDVADVALDLIADIKQAALQERGIAMETEVQIIGEEEPMGL